MTEKQNIQAQTGAALPPDDLRRRLGFAGPADQNPRHIGVVGDTYTILLTGDDTAGRFCLIDMHIPPGGGPPPHRRDFEETFTVIEGELEATFRGMRCKLQARVPFPASRTTRGILLRDETHKESIHCT